MRILVLGGGGMLGSAVSKVLSKDGAHDLVATFRKVPAGLALPKEIEVIEGVDLLACGQPDAIVDAVRPDAVINCVGIIKQLYEVADAALTIHTNALLPHQLSNACARVGARFIHVSTDCVFDGQTGGYTEASRPNATDLYGKSKHLGEVVGADHVVTLRTSIIGHEIGRAVSLVDWFLSQSGSVRGYRKAIYSGLPTVELARVVAQHVLPDPSLSGLFHVVSAPINKFELLKLIAQTYNHDVEIVPYDDFVLDRSMKGEAFAAATGYVAPDWRELVTRMYAASKHSHSRTT